MTIRFKAGQVWRLLGRWQDGDVHVAILAVVEDAEPGQIFSIAMTGVNIPNAFIEGCVQTQLSHEPVTWNILRAAVTDLVESDGPAADDPAFA